MSLMYCDYCNYSTTARSWDGMLTADGENVCSQCESDGVLDN